MKTFPTRPPHILVVDDTQENLQIVGESLSRAMLCDLSFATDGMQALESVEAEPPDLILLDIMMPGMSGLEVCALLKKSPSTAQIPVLFLTAKTEVEDVVAGFKLGAADYIAKPFHAPELIARVQTHLALRQATVAAQQKNQQLQQLLHILCHDLANPLGAIQSLLQMAADAEDFFSMRESLLDVANNAMDLIDRVRQMRALDEGRLKVELKPTNLLECCQQALKILGAKIATKGVTPICRVSADILVEAEPVILTQSIICNMLTNAVKFSYRGSVVRMEADIKTAQTVVFRIVDEGIGMHPTILKSLFDSAHQTSCPGTDGEQGTGFGMLLIKRFVESFGGHITVESRSAKAFPDDHGTTVTLFLNAAGGAPA